MDSSTRSKNILLCISGSISAYRMADVVSQLKKEGHSVQCLLTRSAKEFVTPLVLETLSQKPVYSEIFGSNISGTEHIRLARWPDLIVFAPATAHLMARLALGLADDLVTTVALAAFNKPWMIAPAMNTSMWENPVTQSHLSTLLVRGASLVAPQSGELACGEEGVGKLASVESLLETIRNKLKQIQGSEFLDENKNFDSEESTHALHWQGKKILITAGPTTSAIDAVRYLTNHSTGKMGAALAESAVLQGAEVFYILGTDKGVVRPQIPSHLSHQFHLTEVKTAEEMLKASLEVLPQVHGVIATAAVLDYRVKESANQKLKRNPHDLTLELTPSVDVLDTLKKQATSNQWFFGFAAETDHFIENAQSKLNKKRLDWVFVNPVSKLDSTLESGFGGEKNAGALVDRSGQIETFELSQKQNLASQLLKSIQKSKIFEEATP